jgi:hypothetical protein
MVAYHRDKKVVGVFVRFSLRHFNHVRSGRHIRKSLKLHVFIGKKEELNYGIPSKSFAMVFL